MSKRAYFGTDGIRGQANRHPDDRRGRAARRAGGGQAVPLGRRPPASGGDRQGHAPVRLYDRAGAGGRLHQRGHGRAPVRPPADAGRGDDDPLDARRPRGDDLRLAQQFRRQRHQAVRPRRLQALRREGVPDRGADGRRPAGGPGRAHANSAGWLRIDDAQARYVEIVKATFPRRLSLNGLRVVIDCANGAAYKVAPTALYELGAEVKEVGVSPNGFNINEDCGSTSPKAMSRAVQEYRADIGIALDGDADRLVICDEKGQIVDGDQIMAIIAAAWAEKRPADGRRRGGHGDVQPRPGAVPGRARPEPGAHAGRRPLCHGPDARGRLQPRRRAVRPRHPVGLLHHRRRPDRRPAGAGRAGALRTSR